MHTQKCCFLAINHYNQNCEKNPHCVQSTQFWNETLGTQILNLLREIMSCLIQNKKNCFPENVSASCHGNCSFSFRFKIFLSKCQRLSPKDVYPVAQIWQDMQLWMSWWNSKAWNPVFRLDTLDFLGLLTLLPFNSFNHALNSSGTLGPAGIQVSIQKL